jgi:hypothetical protein
MVEISSFLNGKNLCNIFADLIVKKINESYPDAKTEITVINVRNFFIVRGRTSSQTVVNLSDILTGLYQLYDQELTPKIRIFDLISYDLKFEPSYLHISHSKNKNTESIIKTLTNNCNDLQKNGIYLNLKVDEFNKRIFYGVDGIKYVDQSELQLIFNGYELIKSDFSQDIYVSDKMYGLSNNGLKYYYFILNKIVFNLFSRGFTKEIDLSISSNQKLNKIDNENINLKINNKNNTINSDKLESLILDNFSFELNRLVVEFDLNSFNPLEELQNIKNSVWENYVGTKDLMFL